MEEKVEFIGWEETQESLKSLFQLAEWIVEYEEKTDQKMGLDLQADLTRELPKIAEMFPNFYLHMRRASQLEELWGDRLILALDDLTTMLYDARYVQNRISDPKQKWEKVLDNKAAADDMRYYAAFEEPFVDRTTLEESHKARLRRRWKFADRQIEKETREMCKLEKGL
jgi:hypothetical protein